VSERLPGRDAGHLGEPVEVEPELQVLQQLGCAQKMGLEARAILWKVEVLEQMPEGRAVPLIGGELEAGRTQSPWSVLAGRAWLRI